MNPVIRTAIAFAFLAGVSASGAQAQYVHIVGTGAAPCSTYLEQARSNLLFEREYFAWAQGYMSGVLMLASPGVDDTLDLTPEAMGILDQIGFIRDFCINNPSDDYADGVKALYRKLGGKALK